MSRQTARSNAVKLAYEYTILREQNSVTFKALTAHDSIEDKSYTQLLYNGVVEHFTELNDIIASYSKGFTVERIFNMDLSIMLVALYEILYVDGVPPVVSINEAVEISKQYSTEKSHVFINGILNAFLKANNKANNND